MNYENVFATELKQIGSEWNVVVLDRNKKVIDNTTFKTLSKASEYIDSVTK